MVIKFIFKSLVLGLCMSWVRGHVVLTFPPARRFALDASRAHLTCGMTKGLGPRTSVMSGSTLNITWQTAYPHEGGFKLEILDPLERTLMDLTPIVDGNKFLTLPVTTQDYRVSLPKGFQCADCTIRLLRQATDWNEGFTFASCADVDIVKVEDFVEDCMGRGQVTSNGRCQCHKFYSGSRCQYKNECLEDVDCGPRGHCIDIGGTNWPRRDCYCDQGWFGIDCTKESSMNATNFHLESYSRQDLHPDIQLYWKLLIQVQEIEIVVVAKGTSYVGVGWRTPNLPVECKAFVPKANIVRQSKTFSNSSVSITDTILTASETIPTFTVTTSLPRGSNKLSRVRFPSKRPQITSTTTQATSSSDADDVPVGSSAENIPVTSLPLVTTTTQPPTASSDKSSQVTQVHVKSYTSDNTRKRRQVDFGGVPLTSASILHPMDCVDMVIGAAKGSLGRIGDYYSRDQSTPQRDAFWGGSDDLTAGIAFEKDGVTTIGFRKKITAGETFDHDIIDGPTHFVWARGQADVSNTTKGQRFYVDDELKYHGNGIQRGTTTVNFFQEVRRQVGKQPYHGEWKRPGNCMASDCEYRAIWEFNPITDDIHFTIFTKHTKTWTGIGFSKDKLMNNTDAIIGWVTDNGGKFMMDMWIQGYMPPILDEIQNIGNYSGMRNESGTTLMFRRKRDTGDQLQDLAFSDSECLYMIFPYQGGTYNSINKKFKMHEKTPYVSPKKVCIYAYDTVTPSTLKEVVTEASALPSSESAATTTVALDTTVTTTKITTEMATEATGSRGPSYKVKFRLPVEEHIQTTLETNSDVIFPQIREKIKAEVSSVLQNVTNFDEVEVKNLQKDSNSSSWLIATVYVIITVKSPDSENPLNGEYMSVPEAFNKSVTSGKIGNLIVDPHYLVVDAPIELETAGVLEPNMDEVKSGSDDQLVAIYAIIAAVSALGLLVFVQILCTIYRYRKSKNARISKEHLITNSGWKDYSTNTGHGYNYEPFLPLDNEMNGRPGKKQSLRGNTMTDGHITKNGTATGTKSTLRQSQMPPTYSERRSESLPRVNSVVAVSAATHRHPGYVTHDRSAGLKDGGRASSATGRFSQELQPDFYFMPSQRRYTGDVVRVSVDYNNPNFQGGK